jgi:flagellar M-ring protein FliF
LNNAFTDFLKRMSEGWKKAQRSQRILIIAVIALTIVAIAVVATMANQVEYAVLYSNLSEADAGVVYEELESQGVDVKARANGTIMVPKDQVNQLRYTLTAEGIPSTAAGIDYSIYESASSFGSTDADKAMYSKIQLEQNLSSSINQMSKIKNSVVLLNVAEQSAFVLSDKNGSQSSASVMVTVQPGATLTSSDADAIRSLVATSVPYLPQENITIVDSTMQMYGSGTAEGGTGTVNTQIDLQNRVSEELRQQIINLLSPVFGPEKLSASVNVILNFDKAYTESITLSPPTEDAENMGIIVSMKTMEERILGGMGAEGEPGLDTNGGAPVYQEIDELAGDSVYYQVTEELNAEVNELREQIEKAQGTISELSCSLIIDGGEEMEEMLPQVRTLIATAIGVAEERISVSAMPFEQNSLMQQALDEQIAAAEEAERNELIKFFVMLGAIVGGIVVIIFMITNTAKRRKEMELAAQQAAIAAEEEKNRVDVMVDDEISIEELMNENKDNTLNQIQSLVKKNPDTVAQILRNWLMDEGR